MLSVTNKPFMLSAIILNVIHGVLNSKCHNVKVTKNYIFF